MADKPKHDTPILVMLTLFTMSLFGILFWMAFSTQIVSGVRWIRVGQLHIITLFTSRYDQLLQQMKSLHPDQITPYYLLEASVAVLEALQWPIIILTMLMATYSFFMKEKHPYKRKLSLENMIVEQAKAFPVTAPILAFNPLKANHRVAGSPVPEKLPHFAEALTPEEWIAFNSIPLNQGEIDTDAARRAFVKQLGPRWKSADDLPIHAQALFAAFALKSAGKRLESDEFLGRLSTCWKGGRNLTLSPKMRKEIKRVIADPKQGRVLEKIAAQHAFVIPAMMRCLLHAREQGGVLAPAQFLWLRAVDRNMWYPLNNMGRGAIHAEAAGAMSHFRAEKSASKPIPNPQLDPAVDGLVGYIKENEITQFPAKEYAS